MPNYSVFDKTGKKVSDIALSDAIFAITPNASAMHLCVVAYLANQLHQKPAVDPRRYRTRPQAP